MDWIWFAFKVIICCLVIGYIGIVVAALTCNAWLMGICSAILLIFFALAMVYMVIFLFFGE